MKSVKRKGVSLINVMVFMMFTVMITAQVFFFTKWSAESVAEERELVMYRMGLDSLIDKAKKVIQGESSSTASLFTGGAASLKSGGDSDSGISNPENLQDVNQTQADALSKAINKILSDNNLPEFKIYNLRLKEDNMLDIFKKINTNDTVLRAVLNLAVAYTYMSNGVSNYVERIPNAITTLSESNPQLLSTILEDAGIDLNDDNDDDDNNNDGLGKLTYLGFYEESQYDDEGHELKVSDTGSYTVTIHNLHYTFKDDFTRFSTDKDNPGWLNLKLYERPFPPMPPDEYGSYFLIRIRVKLPDSYYGKQLMYQILVRKDTANEMHTLSYQEVWF